MAKYLVVPLKLKDVEIGHALLEEGGGIQLVGQNASAMKEVFAMAERGFILGLKIDVILNPATDGRLVTRLENEKALPLISPLHIEKNERPNRY